MRTILLAPFVLALALPYSQAQAVGCISGAIAGGVAGHYAGHHAVLGALGGCVAGHELHKRQVAAKRLQELQKPMPGEIVHAEPAPVPPAPTP